MQIHARMDKNASLELTAEEHDRLLKTGFVKISDPERGEIEVRMLFDEDHPGIKGKRILVKVIRSGDGARWTG
jgi:hypothetical protein